MLTGTQQHRVGSGVVELDVDLSTIASIVDMGYSAASTRWAQVFGSTIAFPLSRDQWIAFNMGLIVHRIARVRSEAGMPDQVPNIGDLRRIRVPIRTQSMMAFLGKFVDEMKMATYVPRTTYEVDWAELRRLIGVWILNTRSLESIVPLADSASMSADVTGPWHLWIVSNPPEIRAISDIKYQVTPAGLFESYLLNVRPAEMRVPTLAYDTYGDIDHARFESAVGFVVSMLPRGGA